jgi:hypothetical protein
MNKDFIRNNRKTETARAKVILWGFGDANVSLDDVGSKLKPDHAVTAYLSSKISLNELNKNLRRKGWLMHQSNFLAKLNKKEKLFWSLTKISDSRGKNATMRSALNADPEGTLSTPFTSDEERATFIAPPALPKGFQPCSIIHSSVPQVRIGNEWGWAFDTPPKKE